MHRETKTITGQALANLRRAIYTEMGLKSPKDSSSSYFEQKVIEACEDLGFGDSRKCDEWMMSGKLDRKSIEVLASHLTVGETYFFRDRKALEVLRRSVLASLIQMRRNSSRTLRLWSAGCSTGEEPYTLAMMLMGMLPDWQKWHITILATDININFLAKAARGCYGEWSFRETPSAIRERFFRKTSDGKYEIHSRVRDMVNFSYLNLATDAYPSVLNNTNAMDLILCRNVLMYFEKDRAREVINKFHRSLLDGGYLLVSPVESSNRHFPQFKPVLFDGVTIYRLEMKSTVQTASPAKPPIAAKVNRSIPGTIEKVTKNSLDKSRHLSV
ncbi:MAG: hypothetical protein GF344_15145, partial [Chitinivibrionales bacterium]|nr:hypothetical protein [Chitinivibrionales bacterium]MBD3358043.1 hypothetical protein [Chitinivibrionales bacterium]